MAKTWISRTMDSPKLQPKRLFLTKVSHIWEKMEFLRTLEGVGRVFRGFLASVGFEGTGLSSFPAREKAEAAEFGKCGASDDA